MKKETQNIGKYTLETYRLNADLAFCLAYDNTSYLPGNGGFRFCVYDNEQAMKDEALMLATLMTQKHQIYNTGFSGMKIVANGAINEENKKRILEASAQVLNKHEGRLYTGCDLNMGNEDMDYLFSLTPYVLNGIGSEVNTSTATAYGVYGSLSAVIDQNYPDQMPLSFLIHGLGKIGTVIAHELLANNHQVYTFDINSEAAEIGGAINLSNDPDWYKTPCQFIVLCSKSGVIDHENMSQLQCEWIISSANSPFKDADIEKSLKKQGIQWVPDVISNAGAVICDSYEISNPESYQQDPPSDFYDQIFSAKYEKTARLLALSNRYQIAPSDALNLYFSIANNDKLFTEKAKQKQEHKHVS